MHRKLALHARRVRADWPHIPINDGGSSAMRCFAFLTLCLIILELLLEVLFGEAGGVGRILVEVQRRLSSDLSNRYTIGEMIESPSPDVICRKADAVSNSSRASDL